MARRQRANTATIISMVGVALVLCVVSFAGGALLTGILNKPVDFSGTAQEFWNAMKTQQYDVAHQYLNPLYENLQDFTNAANQADIDLGVINSVTTPSSAKASTGQSIASATYIVHRIGGTKVTKATNYNITLGFTYNSDAGLFGNAWSIADVGNLLTDPSS